MNDVDPLTEQFERARPRLRALAYRMLGSAEEADEAVQEAWLRVARAGADDIDNLGGWLTTITARLCLDRLRRRGARPEEPVGMTALEGVPTSSETADPEQEALLADSVGSAMLVVLDRLPPAERVAFVLHDVFGVAFDEIGGILDRSSEAARQLASRARQRVKGTTPSGDVDLVRHRQVVDAFLAAARGGDFDALIGLLDPDVVLRPDAAAVRIGAVRETRGAAAVAEFMSGGARGTRRALVGGVAGLAWMPGARLRGAVSFTIAEGRITAIDLVGDGRHLAELDVVVLED